MVLNTPSYGGGSDLWDEARAAPLPATTRHFQSAEARPPRMDDGLLEVVGVTDVLHLAYSLGGLSNGVRLCQGAHSECRRASTARPCPAPQFSLETPPRWQERRAAAIAPPACERDRSRPPPLIRSLARPFAVRLAVPQGGVPIQIDGEPYNIVPREAAVDGEEGAAVGLNAGGLEPFNVELSYEGQALMLARSPRSTPREGNAFAAVEAQLRRRGLSTAQRDALLWTLAGAEGGVVHHAGAQQGAGGGAAEAGSLQAA